MGNIYMQSFQILQFEEGSIAALKRNGDSGTLCFTPRCNISTFDSLCPIVVDTCSQDLHIEMISRGSPSRLSEGWMMACVIVSNAFVISSCIIVMPLFVLAELRNSLNMWSLLKHSDSYTKHFCLCEKDVRSRRRLSIMPQYKRHRVEPIVIGLQFSILLFSFPGLGIRVVLFLFHIVVWVPLIIMLKRSLRASFADGPVTCFFLMSGPGAAAFFRSAILAPIFLEVMAL